MTDSNGAQRLQFTSAGAAFQVNAATKTANALMGNFKASSTVTSEGADVASTVTAAGAMTAPPARQPPNSTSSRPMAAIPPTLTCRLPVRDRATKLSCLEYRAGDQCPRYHRHAGRQRQAGIYVDLGKKLPGDGDQRREQRLRPGRMAGRNFATTSYTAATGGIGRDVCGRHFKLPILGQWRRRDHVKFDAAVSVATTKANLQAAFDNNATLKAAGLTATVNSGTDGIDLSSSTGDAFRMSYSAGTDLKLSGAAAVAAAGILVASNSGMSTNNVTTESASAASTGLGTANDVISFSGMRVKTDSQQISISTVDSAGALQSTSITLSGNAANTATYAGNIDKAISNINAQLQGTGNATLMKITAVKELNDAGTAEGIRFISSRIPASV